jgi:hypothetical protein
MKTLAILLFALTSLSVNAGWFGSDIKGAFGVELGDINTDASGSLSPKKSLPMFDSYDFFTTPISNKIYLIKASAEIKYDKRSYPARDCYGPNGGHFRDIKEILGKFKHTQDSEKTLGFYFDEKIDEYTYKSKGREINIYCSTRYVNDRPIIPPYTTKPSYSSYYLALSYVDLELKSLNYKEKKQLKKEEVKSKSRGYDI